MQCKSCAQENAEGSKFCSVCGLPLPPEASAVPGAGTICPACQHINVSDSFFCYYCGNYFLQSAEQTLGNGLKKTVPAENAPAVKAKVTIPGRPEIILSGSPIFIERSSFDQTLPHDVLMSISRQHVLITYENGTYYIQDFGRDGTGSTNHTRLNDTDIYHKGRQPLKDGDRIELARQSELTVTFNLI